MLVDGLLTREQTAIAAAVFYVLGCTVGLLVVGAREPRVLLVVVAFVLLAALPLLGISPGVWGGFIGLPPALRAALRLRRGAEVTARIIPAQAWTLLAFVLYFGAGAGLLIV